MPPFPSKVALITGITGQDGSYLAELPLVEQPLPADDPLQRQPVIAQAQQELGWQPTVPLEQGLEPTSAYFREALGTG